MKEIQLTQGKKALVDDQDYEALMSSGYTWYAMKREHTYYAYGYNKESKENRYALMHRLIMCPPKNLTVDHVDKNGLNNTRANLRIASMSQQTQNTRLCKDSSTGYKGTSFVKKKGKYRAYITVKGHFKSLGYYEHSMDAAKAYNEAAKKYFGEYACPNQIGGE